MNFRPLPLKKELSDFFQKIHDPGYAKKLKKWEIYTKFIFGSKQPKKLWNTSATPFVKFPMNFRPVTIKKELGDFFQKIHDPRYAKKLKKWEIYTKFIFGSKQPKKLWNMSATPFVKFPMNFRPVTIKKELGDFSKIPWTRISKKTQKIRNLYKFFLARNNLKSLKIRLQHHLWSFRWISSW